MERSQARRLSSAVERRDIRYRDAVVTLDINNVFHIRVESIGSNRGGENAMERSSERWCAVLFNPSSPRQNLRFDISFEIARIYRVYRKPSNDVLNKIAGISHHAEHTEQLLRLLSKRHLRIHACLNGNKANVGGKKRIPSFLTGH